ncbi:hypothetical protein NM688_g7655 [Phlebia brevispora]|uniref:Uncharacterized protein n=1 Tax=Phlebia brevispora TaxID=194682 RepID=A0ACC1S2U9_9APHY|nr:hypothetical protein NM688_g7655 [Phlebia brevispora]
MSVPPPSAPAHLLRTHGAAVAALYISDDNERLYSGDAAGVVVITSTRSFRPLANWQAHKDSILGITEWEKQIITHGRDNKLHVWTLMNETETQLGESAVTPGLSAPTLKYSMDVNALNYCRFSLLPLSNAVESTALIALPNLVESSLVDVWELPSQKRLHAAIGKTAGGVSSDGRGGEYPTGRRVTCFHVGLCQPKSADFDRRHRLGKTLDGEASQRNRPVMAMSVSRDAKVALTVSVDHIIGRYDLQAAQQQEDVTTACTVHRTKHPGNGSVTIRDDGRVCAVGGWDGKVRLFSTKSLKPLGILDYHKKSCQCAIFARLTKDAREDRNHEEDSDDEMSKEEKEERSRWLIVGSQDTRVSIWPLISFEKTS